MPDAEHRFALCYFPWQQLSFMIAKRNLAGNPKALASVTDWGWKAVFEFVEIGLRKMQILANSFCLYA